MTYQLLEDNRVTINPKILEKIMSKPTEPGSTPITDELKDQNAKYSLSKFDFDLYHEEDDIANKVIRVKRVPMPNKGEKWKITCDNKLLFTIEGNKISKKEKEYLQTVDGFNFMLSQAKTGIKSLNSFRMELKKKLDQAPAEAVATISVKPPAAPKKRKNIKKSKKK